MTTDISEMQLKHVEDAETVCRLISSPQAPLSHPSHAGIEMFLDSGVLYKSCACEPTPHEILILQLYLSSIVDKVIEK